MTVPRLLDLFCGLGGAARGYQLAGFYVVGVDINEQPHYVGDEFVQADATMFPLDGFDAYHASPPCQFATQMSARWRKAAQHTRAKEHIDLLTPTLARFRQLTAPWVVENVVGAAKLMRSPVKLHGGMFGLGVHRPRMFESNILILSSRAAQTKEPIGVYGHTADGRRLWTRQNGDMKGKRSIMRAARSLKEAQDAMGIEWGDWHGVKEAIPPAYSEWIGRQLIAHIEQQRAA